MNPDDRTGWDRYAERVLGELADMKDSLRDLRAEIADLKRDDLLKLKVEVAMLKVKSGLWGAAAGFVPAILVFVIELLKGG